MINYTGKPAFAQFGEFVRPKSSLTEGSIPRALLAHLNGIALWSFIFFGTSMLMSVAYYRFGGWRKIRMGVANALTAPVPSV